MVDALIREETRRKNAEPVIDNELDKSYESMGSSEKDRIIF